MYCGLPGGNYSESLIRDGNLIDNGVYVFEEEGDEEGECPMYVFAVLDNEDSC